MLVFRRDKELIAYTVVQINDVNILEVVSMQHSAMGAASLVFFAIPPVNCVF